MKYIGILLILVISLAVTSCSKPPELVTKEELFELTKTWKEPKLAIWYYFGSNTDYDFFLFQDIDDKKAYRTKKEEKVIEEEFEVTSNREKWRVMPWGPHATQDLQNQAVLSTPGAAPPPR